MGLKRCMPLMEKYYPILLRLIKRFSQEFFLKVLLLKLERLCVSQILFYLQKQRYLQNMEIHWLDITAADFL